MSKSGEKVEIQGVSRSVSRKTPQKSSELKLQIPPSPAMTKLGYGTGVHIFLLERYSPKRGYFGSPLAVKKINRKLRQAEDKATFPKKPNEGLYAKRLECEAKLLRSMAHPNIIGYRAYTEAADGCKCLVMESGERDLYSILEDCPDNKPLSVHKTFAVCLGVSRALKYLHEEKHLLHGDMKSGNILIKGDFKEVKLCDFGICLKLNKKLEAEAGECYVGTECWSPPEALRGSQITDRSDIFAFGLTIWECVALRPPHIDSLSCESSDNSLLSSAEQERLFQEQEELFQAAVGTRPALPASAALLTGAYLRILEAFKLCTEAEPRQRPPARVLVQLFDSMQEQVQREIVPLAKRVHESLRIDS